MNGQVSRHPGPRVAGVVYLLYFIAAFLTVFLLRGLVIPGNAAATANNILTQESLYRSGLAVDLVGNALYIVLTALLYRLLGPVNWGISLVAAFFSLAGCIAQIVGAIFRLVPLTVLKDAQVAQLFSLQQLQSLGALSLTIHAQTFSISLVLFGLYDLLLGYLVVKSTFLPRLIGALLMCAGAAWLSFLWPPLARTVSAYVLPFGALAEIVFMLWLLVRGVDVPRWQQVSAGSWNR
jgi:hypothetical protein